MLIILFCTIQTRRASGTDIFVRLWVPYEQINHVALALAAGLALAACDMPHAHIVVSLPQAGPWEGQVTAVHLVQLGEHGRKTDQGTESLTSEVRPASELQDLQVGERIQGRIVVEGQGIAIYITDIRVVR